MENHQELGRFGEMLKGSIGLARKFIFTVLLVGPVPNHIALILDGNRRYARKHNLKGRDAGHRAGFVSLTYILKYCRELGIKYVSVYAFGIDNFKREPEDVKCVMDLMLEKFETAIDQAISGDLQGVKIIVSGELGLLNERLRIAAQRLMEVTAANAEIVIIVSVAYSNAREMVHAVRESCLRKCDQEGSQDPLKVSDIDEFMYMTAAPEPELLVRTGGGNRLSNYMLWQTSRCLLSSTAALWPEFGFRRLVWEILKYQRMYSHLQKKKKME